MYAVCMPLRLFHFELSLRTIAGPKSKYVEGTDDTSSKFSSICQPNTVTTAFNKLLNLSFSASKRKITLLVCLVRAL